VVLCVVFLHKCGDRSVRSRSRVRSLSLPPFTHCLFRFLSHTHVSDTMSRAVTEAEVLGSEGYVLFYRRQS
jgi:hypothetical protein